jgi:hypothetical protein
MNKSNIQKQQHKEKRDEPWETFSLSKINRPFYTAAFTSTSMVLQRSIQACFKALNSSCRRQGKNSSEQRVKHRRSTMRAPSQSPTESS